MGDYLVWVVELLIGVIFLLIGWVFKMVFNDIKDIEKNQKTIDKSLADHKLHAAETFATKIDVDKGFDRVMSKLDTMDEKSDASMRALNVKIDTKADKL
jgi:hypothetical protein